MGSTYPVPLSQYREEVPLPLDGMLELVRELLQRAHGGLGLGWIDAVAVALGRHRWRKHDLHVTWRWNEVRA